ncbi:hypothetical protein ANAEL_04719 [Anaerolineales bacterium]|nr:hypothetical protein ANAEL_04719 [Anaerolineales bacterium]
MSRNANKFMFLLMVLAMLLSSAIGTTPVYADDGVTAGETSEPVGGETPPVEDAVPPEPSGDEVTPSEEQPTPVEESTPVSEILEQLPGETEVTVVNEEGEVEPLASIVAAEIVQSGDPRYTLSGTTYYFMPIGGCGALTNCTESATPIQAAINALSGAGGTPDDGTIYIDAGTYAENVTIDGNAWGGGGSTPASLTLNGAGSATTILDGRLSVTNMNIFTLSGLAIVDNDTSGNATYLDISNDGGLDLYDVSVTNNAGDGAILTGGTGDVTVSNSEFNGSSLTGLYIDTFGSATLTDVTATGNGYGLDIIADQGIDLTNVNASDNDYFGAILDTTYGTGAITVNSSDFGMDATSGNGWTGLHAESGSTITLNSVVASYNGTNGAYLVAEGNISVNNSTFNNNVNFNYPEDPGLFALSNGGNITLNSVTANNNVYGAGAVLNTSGAGTVTVTGGQYNGNGTFGVQSKSENGNITLNGVTASFNHVKGAYLNSCGTGNIFINNNSSFIENGSYGIYASTAKGNINVDLVTVTGDNGVDDAVVGEADNLTDYGAVLVAGTGDVFVSNSSFNLNTNVGLKVVSGGQVDLVNVVADQNGGNGIEVYSTSTAQPICSGDSPVNITVNVDGGTFTNNGGYGLLVKPGPQGTLVFANPSTFGGNALGDYLLDLSQGYKDCTPEPKDPPVKKEPKVVDVPSTGGPVVEQECDTYTSTILNLPNGTSVEIGCPFTGFNKLEEVSLADLPGPLGDGITFEAAIMLGLIDAEGNILLNEDGTVTVKFMIPTDARGRRHSILFWDATLNDGQGGWIQLPPYEIGTSFPLNPDNPDDPRTIISGVKQVGDTVTVTVNFPGIFVLVTR